MSALTLIPRHWYSWDFFVTDDDRQLAEFNLSSWREKGVVSVDGIDYRLYRESSFGDFVLEHAGSVIARATKPSAFRREFVIRYKEQPYTLRAQSFSRTYIVLDGSTEIGSIAPEKWFTRTANVDLPDNWPFLLKSFAMWLTIIQWKRDAG
ncbi:MAG TPA: hypothetical protein VFB92_19210 [Vicinamibacterales bacterium]|jgi:hypothetical protein|nr:hypothetical protein [Vicinamibacterales bacterium]